jgi:hypothetical protein
MHLQFEALLSAARRSANRNDFALVAMLGLVDDYAGRGRPCRQGRAVQSLSEQSATKASSLSPAAAIYAACSAERAAFCHGGVNSPRSDSGELPAHLG